MEHFVGLLNQKGDILYFTNLKPGITVDNFNSFSDAYYLGEDPRREDNYIEKEFHFALYDRNIRITSRSSPLTANEVVYALAGYLHHMTSSATTRIHPEATPSPKMQGKGSVKWLTLAIITVAAILIVLSFVLAISVIVP